MLDRGDSSLSVSTAYAVASCAPIAIGEQMSESDFEFLDMALWLGGWSESREFLRCEFARMAAATIEANRAAFARITAALLQRKKLTGDDVAALMAEATGKQ
jgi:hypothetical protein